MNWDAIGAVAEAIGAGGVILTLLFVAAQVGQSVRATEANSRELRETKLRYSSDAITRFSELIAANGEVANIWRRGGAGEELSPDEAVRFFWLFRNFIQIHSTGFYYEDANSTKQASNVQIVAEFILNNDGFNDAWLRAARAFRNADRTEFVDAVERMLESKGNNDTADA